MTGILRWVRVGMEGDWHLRFGGGGGPTLCDRYLIPRDCRTRWLSEGAPAGRCPACIEVITLRLGLSR